MALADDPALVERFARSEAQAFGGDRFQITDDGIWVPTPLAVIDEALAALADMNFWTDTMTCLDAGMGDGRIVAALALRGPGVRALGLETHPGLHALALANLRDLPPRWSVHKGSFLELASYAALDAPIAGVDVVLHYPDGGEQALARLFAAHGRPGARLVYLTPELRLRIEGVTHECTHRVTGGFHLHLFRVGA
ncbi:MAG: class I SAM-dependent methyltransferase [Myxococcales bacterium]|nr:class I SAM-dependent methyltransferase [Myxococcales bacterium]